jgi:hypothetical protein
MHVSMEYKEKLCKFWPMEISNKNSQYILCGSIDSWKIFIYTCNYADAAYYMHEQRL